MHLREAHSDLGRRGNDWPKIVLGEEDIIKLGYGRAKFNGSQNARDFFLLQFDLSAAAAR